MYDQHPLRVFKETTLSTWNVDQFTSLVDLLIKSYGFRVNIWKRKSGGDGNPLTWVEEEGEKRVQVPFGMYEEITRLMGLCMKWTLNEVPERIPEQSRVVQSFNNAVEGVISTLDFCVGGGDRLQVRRPIDQLSLEDLVGLLTQEEGASVTCAVQLSMAMCSLSMGHGIVRINNIVCVHAPVTPPLNHRGDDGLKRCLGVGVIGDKHKQDPGLLDTVLGVTDMNLKTDNVWCVPTLVRLLPERGGDDTADDTVGVKLDPYYLYAGSRELIGCDQHEVIHPTLASVKTFLSSVIGSTNAESVVSSAITALKNRLKAGVLLNEAGDLLSNLQQRVLDSMLCLILLSVTLAHLDERFSRLSSDEEWKRFALFLLAKLDDRAGKIVPFPSSARSIMRYTRILFRAWFPFYCGFLDGLGRVSAVTSALMNRIPDANPELESALPETSAVSLGQISLTNMVRFARLAMVEDGTPMLPGQALRFREDSQRLQAAIDASVSTSIQDQLTGYLRQVSGNYAAKKLWAPPTEVLFPLEKGSGEAAEKKRRAARDEGLARWTLDKAFDLWEYLLLHPAAQLTLVLKDMRKDRTEPTDGKLIDQVLSEIGSFLNGSYHSRIAEKNKKMVLWWITCFILDNVWDRSNDPKSNKMPESLRVLSNFMQTDGQGLRSKRVTDKYSPDRTHGYCLELRPISFQRYGVGEEAVAAPDADTDTYVCFDADEKDVTPEEHGVKIVEPPTHDVYTIPVVDDKAFREAVAALGKKFVANDADLAAYKDRKNQRDVSPIIPRRPGGSVPASRLCPDDVASEPAGRIGSV